MILRDEVEQNRIRQRDVLLWIIWLDDVVNEVIAGIELVVFAVVQAVLLPSIHQFARDVVIHRRVSSIANDKYRLHSRRMSQCGIVDGEAKPHHFGKATCGKTVIAVRLAMMTP